MGVMKMALKMSWGPATSNIHWLTRKSYKVENWCENVNKQLMDDHIVEMTKIMKMYYLHQRTCWKFLQQSYHFQNRESDHVRKNRVDLYLVSKADSPLDHRGRTASSFLNLITPVKETMTVRYILQFARFFFFFKLGFT